MGESVEGWGERRTQRRVPCLKDTVLRLSWRAWVPTREEGRIWGRAADIIQGFLTALGEATAPLIALQEDR